MLRIKALNDQETSGNEDDSEKVTKEAEVCPQKRQHFFPLLNLCVFCAATQAFRKKFLRIFWQEFPPFAPEIALKSRIHSFFAGNHHRFRVFASAQTQKWRQERRCNPAILRTTGSWSTWSGIYACAIFFSCVLINNVCDVHERRKQKKMFFLLNFFSWTSNVIKIKINCLVSSTTRTEIWDFCVKNCKSMKMHWIICCRLSRWMTLTFSR